MYLYEQRHSKGKYWVVCIFPDGSKTSVSTATTNRRKADQDLIQARKIQPRN